MARDVDPLTQHPSPETVPGEGGGSARPPGKVDVVDLIRAHHATVYAYAYRLTCSPVDAEDLTQQTFLTAHEKSAQIRDPEKALGWLLAVTRGRFLKNQRRRQVASEVNLEWELNEIPDSTSRREANWDYERLDQALAKMPETYRVVIVMYYFEDLSYKEITRELKLPIGTIMSRLSRGKEYLRKQLTLEEVRGKR